MSSNGKILVPVDFSESSREALEFALRIARQHGSRVDVLHVWEAPRYVTSDVLAQAITQGGQSLEDTVRDGAASEMRAFLAGLTIPGDTRIELGSPVDVIVEVADAGEYDTIVIGTRGRTGLRNLVFGSVAAKVVQRAGCPVLTIRLGGRMPRWLDH